MIAWKRGPRSDVARWTAIVLLGAVAVVSTAGTVLAAREVGVRHPGPVLASFGIAASAVGAVYLVARSVPAARLNVVGVATAFALLIAVRVLTLAAVPAPLVADWLRYHELAVEILESGPRLDVVPTGFATLLAAVYGAVGVDPLAGQIAQIVLAVITGVLVYATVAKLVDHRAALAALLIWALAPSQILMGAVLSSEPLYTFLIVAAFSAVVHWPTTAGPILAGVTLGASQYVRATTLVLVPVFAYVAWRYAARDRTARAPALLVASFVIVLVPVLVWNLSTHGAVSLSTSGVQNFSLLVGLNQESEGRWNEADYRLVGSEYGTESSERIAGEVAIERLTGDPIGIIGLAIRKFGAWGDEGYGAYWAVAVANPNAEARIIPSVLSDIAWAVVTILALLAVATNRIGGPLLTTTTLLVAALTLTHSVFEAQGRYHSYLWPFLAGVAAVAITAAWRPKSERHAEGRGGAGAEAALNPRGS